MASTHLTQGHGFKSFWSHIIITSGYIFTYDGGVISWSSKLQECTALSRTEAEYITASDATKEVICLHRLSVNFSATRRLDHLLRLSERNTPYSESSLSREDETY